MSSRAACVLLMLLAVTTVLFMAQPARADDGLWSDWSACSAKTCGGGNQTRYCAVPPTNGGLWCNQTSSPESIRACNTATCSFLQANGASAGAAVATVIVLILLVVAGIVGVKWYRARVAARRSIEELAKSQYSHATHEASHYETSSSSPTAGTGRGRRAGGGEGAVEMNANSAAATDEPAAATGVAGAPLPDGQPNPWSKQFDAITHQRHYWFNNLTGESLWLPPPGWVEPDGQQ